MLKWLRHRDWRSKKEGTVKRRLVSNDRLLPEVILLLFFYIYFFKGASYKTAENCLAEGERDC